MAALDFLHSWNPTPLAHLHTVQLEDDSLRDGLQGAFVRKPSIEQKQELLQLAAGVGVDAAMLGFPAMSAAEQQDCRTLVRFIEQRKLRIVPRFLARAKIEDVAPIAELNRESDVDVWADFFVGVSPLRRHVEKWPHADVLRRITEVAQYLRAQRCRFGISIEDASRTPPDELKSVIDAALDGGAEILTICDTVGDLVPAGAERLVRYVLDVVARRGQQAAVWWHGHNDKGLALANAIAAAAAGAHAVSGSFLGIGERTGNTALEQVVMYLHQSGSKRFRVDRLVAYCRKLAEYTDSAISAHAPLVGSQAFATCTGTHAAAIIKARALGADFEDYVFSGVPASELGRLQEVLIGPTSGAANARHMLERLHQDACEANVNRLLQYAKTKDRWLSSEEILSLFS
jgi:isopropylmalate/homocitrate/citramalate synthase